MYLKRKLLSLAIAANMGTGLFRYAFAERSIHKLPLARENPALRVYGV